MLRVVRRHEGIISNTLAKAAMRPPVSSGRTGSNVKKILVYSHDAYGLGTIGQEARRKDNQGERVRERRARDEIALDNRKAAGILAGLAQS